MNRMIEAPRVRRPAYFWWLLANVLAGCFAVLSWALCLYVFGHLEVPRNYEILARLGRLPERKAVTAEQAPAGNVLGPKELYRKFFGMTGKDTQRMNSLLLRNYLTNSANSEMLTYLEGEFRVRTVRVLEDGDFLNPGIVVSAEAMVKPDEASPAAPYPVWIEYVLPGVGSEVASLFVQGEAVEVQKSPHCASVVHVDKAVVDGEETLWLTIIPVVSGPYTVGKRTFEIGLPARVRPKAGLPLMKSQ